MWVLSLESDRIAQQRQHAFRDQMQGSAVQDSPPNSASATKEQAQLSARQSISEYHDTAKLTGAALLLAVFLV